MGKKLNKVYDALLAGAADGLRDRQLYNYVTERCVRAAVEKSATVAAE